MTDLSNVADLNALGHLPEKEQYKLGVQLLKDLRNHYRFVTFSGEIERAKAIYSTVQDPRILDRVRAYCSGWLASKMRK